MTVCDLLDRHREDIVRGAIRTRVLAGLEPRDVAEAIALVGTV